MSVFTFDEEIERVRKDSIGGIRVRRRSSIVRRPSLGFDLELPEDDNYELGLLLYSEEEDDYKSSIKTKIDDFIPVKVLGQGAYGKVLLVKHKASGKLFAQKQLKKLSIVVSKNCERTLLEKKILSLVTHHPNIVKLFYALHDSFKIYLILEYVPGGELFMHLSNQKFLNDKITSFYSAEMTLALVHLHKLGIVYRDLKPENCLLDSRGHLILTDFGLSKQTYEDDDQDFCNSMIGTPEYMAPEVLKGENYSYEVDWWSLGCVIFDMLSGKPPFTGNNHKTIMNRILKDKVKFPFYFTQQAKDLLNKLLNKNPNKRFQVDMELEKFQKHPFFRHINWDQLQKQDPSIEPPIIPIITDPELLENFDPQFTGMKMSELPIEDDGLPIENKKLTKTESQLFDGFSYQRSNSYIEKYLG